VAGGGSRTTGARRLVSITDQVCSSASNFLLMFLVARSAASTSTFGTFTLGFALLTFVMTVSRSVLGVPLGTDLHLLAPAEKRLFVGRSVASALALGTAVTTALVLASLFVSGHREDLRMGLLLLAVAAPVVMAQDIGRYVAVAVLRPWTALCSDVVWLAIVGVVLTLDAVTSWHPSLAWALALWGLGALLALGLVSSALELPVFRRLGTWLRQDVRRGHLLLDSLMAAGVPLLIALSVTVFASATVLGSLRGASTLLGPLNIAIASVGLALVPDAARRDERGARRIMAWASGFLALGAVAWSLLLLMLPDRIGIALMNTIWGPAVHVLPVAALEYVGLAAWTGAGSYFRARRQTLLLLRFRYLYSGLSVLAALAATWIWGTPRAIAGATAAGAVCVGALSWLRLLNARERPREQALSR
jgi:hypothetical protein